MAKKIEAWLSATGNVHKTEDSAMQEDKRNEVFDLMKAVTHQENTDWSRFSIGDVIKFIVKYYRLERK